MASELRVNTLKDAAGNNSIATSFVAGGSAKSFINFNAATPAIRKSFNVSSLDDNGTGLFDVNFSSAMGDVNYTLTSGSGDVGGNDVFHIAFAGANTTPTAPTTANYPLKLTNAAGNAFVDVKFSMATVNGDLA
jgi:hypothetical protein